MKLKNKMYPQDDREPKSEFKKKKKKQRKKGHRNKGVSLTAKNLGAYE